MREMLSARFVVVLCSCSLTTHRRQKKNCASEGIWRAPAVPTNGAEGLPVVQNFTYVVALVDESLMTVSLCDDEHMSIQHPGVNAKGLASAARHMPLALRR